MADFLLGCLVGAIVSRFTFGPRFEVVVFDKKWFPNGIRPRKVKTYRDGQAEMRKRAAECVTTHYQTLSQEHRLLLVNRATAIAELDVQREK